MVQGCFWRTWCHCGGVLAGQCVLCRPWLWGGMAYFSYDEKEKGQETGLRQYRKKKTVVFMTVAMMLLTGCSTADTASGRTDGSADGTVNASGTETEAASDSAGQEAASEEVNEGNQDGSAEGHGGKEPEEKQYTWQEYTVTLPGGWEGRCVMEEDEAGFRIYQKASYEKDDTTGYICGFFRTQEPAEYDHGRELIAYTEDGTLYYMIQPTDVPCDTDDEEIAGEYLRMCQQVLQLKTSLQIAVPGLHDHADEYILPTSSIFPLDPVLLGGYSDYSLWIARNEIYARHGRQFTNEYLQQYFNRCTWYEGKIPPQEFQESALSQIERDNLQLLSAAEKEYHRQHPYPKKFPASETVSEDLDGDGRKERISYQVVEQNNWGVLCMLTVNGDTYTINEQFDVWMDNPITDCFYITDILEDDGALEIAVLDEGPSSDPVTYFFQYDGALSYLGLVAGFPFADVNGGWNGFDGYGGITGRSRTDLIETAYLRDHWWYDGSSIVDLDIGWYEYDYSFSPAHVLYEDLPVYCEMEETPAVTVIPAQEEVYFLGTDVERWILVKGKDGSQGYMLVEDGNIVGLNKPADQVFSDLHFFD